jgi:hypothetical protein
MPRGRPKKQGDLLVRSAEMIGWALGGLEREIALTRERLSTLTSQANVLRARLGRAGASRAGAASGDAEPRAMNEGKAGSGKRRRRRRMSPEARKRISEMMKKRWAERRKAKG